MGKDDRRRAMVATNLRQQEFYESRFEAYAARRGSAERAAGTATRLWTRLRRRIQRLRASLGVDEELLSLHREWLGDLTSACVLDLGCFTGNQLSLEIARQAHEYVGVDLSEQAIDELNLKFAEAGITGARALKLDFLDNPWPNEHFDAVYAYSVLHHFANLDVALTELRRIVKPGGIVITMDPMQTEPLNRLARRIYRPFQSDRDWEFPFTRRTLSMFERHFDVAARQGLQGSVKLAYPLLLIPGLQNIGTLVGEWLRRFDSDHARERGITFYACWHVTMKLIRPA